MFPPRAMQKKYCLQRASPRSSHALSGIRWPWRSLSFCHWLQISVCAMCLLWWRLSGQGPYCFSSFRESCELYVFSCLSNRAFCSSSMLHYLFLLPPCHSLSTQAWRLLKAKNKLASYNISGGYTCDCLWISIVMLLWLTTEVNHLATGNTTIVTRIGWM